MSAIASFFAALVTAFFATFGFAHTPSSVPVVSNSQRGYESAQAENHGPTFIKSPTYAIHPQKADWLIISADGPDQSVDLTGWTIRSTESGKSFTIKPPSTQKKVLIGSNDTAVFIHTVGSPNKSYVGEGEWHLYFGESTVAWGKDHDTIQLVDPSGKVIDTYSYGNQQASVVSVLGMSKYTDADFGFSFWYPSGWTVTSTSTSYRGCTRNTYEGDGTYEKILLLSNGKAFMQLSEYFSPKGVVYGCGKADDHFYYDSNIEKWMYKPRWDDFARGTAGTPVAADISLKTMGGLPIWAETIALSHDHFVVVDDNIGGVAILSPVDPLIKTIMATDPSIATPVSAAEQIKTIQAEKDAYVQ